jgi:hypothetical protein
LKRSIWCTSRFAAIYSYGYTGETLKRTVQSYEAAYLATLY